LNYKIEFLGREAYFDQINLNMEVTTKKHFTGSCTQNHKKNM